MNKSLAVVRRRKQEVTLYDDKGKVSEATLAELGGAGYWGPPMRLGAPPEVAEITLVSA